MSRVFLMVLQMDIIGSFCILVVLAARFLLRKLPRKFSYFLWFVVFLRLLCPVFPDGPFSLIPNEIMALPLEMPEDSYKEQTRPVPTGWNAHEGEAGGVAVPVPAGRVTGSQQQEVSKGVTDWILGGFSVLWLCGAAVLFLGNGISYWRLKLHVKNARFKEKGIYYLSEKSGGREVLPPTSFVLGIFRPVICLVSGLEAEEEAYILCHERIHIRRRDYLIKPLALAAVCVHWFNPLVWLAFRLMNQDMEISCDEQVIEKLGEESKKAYSRTLLVAAGKCRGRTVSSVLSFGDGSVRKRVYYVLHYRRAPLILTVTAAGVLVLAAAGLLLNPRKGISEDAFIEAVRREGGYDERDMAVCFMRDYEGDRKQEAFVEIGRPGEEYLEGDLWYVSEDGELWLLKEQVLLKQEQEYFDYGKGSLLLLSYIDGNPVLTDIYGVSDGYCIRHIPSVLEEKYMEGNSIICMQSSYDMDYDREMEILSGHTRKPYAFYYDGDAVWPYVAEEISRDEVAAYKNGSEILAEEEQGHSGCMYQYLLRENGLLHINRAQVTEDYITFTYATYRVDGNKLVFLEEGEGCYQKDMTNSTEKTFVGRVCEENQGMD